MAATLVIAALAICAAIAVAAAQPRTDGGQLRNQYWPFSVEMQIRDR